MFLAEQPLARVSLPDGGVISFIAEHSVSTDQQALSMKGQKVMLPSQSSRSCTVFRLFARSVSPLGPFRFNLSGECQS